MPPDLTHLHALAVERSEHIRALVALEDELRAELARLHAAGAQKSTLAEAAGISRPTLDAWLTRPPRAA